MNKIDKYIKKLIPKEREAMLDVLERIKHGILADLDMKKLKGYANLFRVRKGKTRFIFHLDINGSPVIDDVDRRGDNTYKKL